jgi:hypothetical protein
MRFISLSYQQTIRDERSICCDHNRDGSQLRVDVGIVRYVGSGDERIVSVLAERSSGIGANQGKLAKMRLAPGERQR